MIQIKVVLGVAREFHFKQVSQVIQRKVVHGLSFEEQYLTLYMGCACVCTCVFGGGRVEFKLENWFGLFCEGPH